MTDCSIIKKTKSLLRGRIVPISTEHNFVFGDGLNKAKQSSIFEEDDSSEATCTSSPSLRHDDDDDSNAPFPTSNDEPSSLAKFSFCFLGINGCYLTYGFVQERLFHIDASSSVGPITTFLLVNQSCTNVLLSFIIILTSTEQTKLGTPTSIGNGLNHRALFCTACSYAAAMTFSNESLNYVSYPTATLCKSCKMVPTMISGFFMNRDRSNAYSAKEWIGASLITVGIVLFNFSRLQSSTGSDNRGDSPFGLLLLFFSLVMDGVLSAFQTYLKQVSHDVNESSSRAIISTCQNKNQMVYRNPTANEAMLFTNLYALLFFLPYSLITKQFHNGILIFPHCYHMIITMNMLAGLGQCFIFYTVHQFNPLVCTTITTTRKLFTIVISVWLFGHGMSSDSPTFGYQQWMCVGLVFCGIYLEIVAKSISPGIVKEKKV